MAWSAQQEKAIKAVNHWYRKSDQQVFKLFGYAGTGKSTIAMDIAKGINGQVLFAAFTG
ncbi:ATP-binding protein, partial [Escherichia coli]|nr:ATP-binding protein [Escherichia coli]